MKKTIITLTLLAGIALNVYAWEPFSVSLGFNFAFANDDSSVDYIERRDLGENWISDFVEIPLKERIKISGLGPQIFFDATYFEASAGAYFNFVKNMTQITNSGPYESKIEPGAYRIFSAQIVTVGPFMAASLSFSFLAKLPITIKTVSFYPMGGIDYYLYIPDRIPDLDILNTLYFKFGGGIDFSFKSVYFIRLKALYGIGLEKEVQRERARADSGDYSDYRFNGSSGLTVGIGFGKKLGK